MMRVAVTAAVVATVVGAGAGIGAYAAFDRNRANSTTSISLNTAPAPSPTQTTGTVAGAAAVIDPSVVTINVTGDSGSGTGSGIVMRSDGYVLTNNHVVTLDSTASATATTISVTLDNAQDVQGSVVGTDPTDDLAVVKLASQRKLAAATFAKSASLVVGQTVVAIGAPLGLSNTVTSGIVSALARPVQAGSTGESIFDAIQTDAAINPGNSGGPLVDVAGRVIGINSAIASASSTSGSTDQTGSIGIGFAIPSDEATRIAGELIATGTATHATIGVAVASSDTQTGGPTSAAGATIQSVTAGGPAATAGITAGDLVTAVGKQRIDDSVDLIAAVRSYPPGQTVQLTITHNGATRTVSVTLGSSS